MDGWGSRRWWGVVEWDGRAGGELDGEWDWGDVECKLKFGFWDEGKGGWGAGGQSVL